jgi:macrolide-specific efflux system membrane fusion protein
MPRGAELSSLPQRKKLIRTTILASLAVGLFGSFMTYGGLSGNPSFNEVVAEKGSITLSVLATGRVQPDNRVDVKAPLAGRAEEVLVKMGDHVRQGQPLMWMSSFERASILDAAKASKPGVYEEWEKLLRPTAILAPVDGTIIQRNIEPGQTFDESNAVFVIADRLIVEAAVDETDVSRLHSGQEATTVLDAYPGHVLPAHVSQVSFEARTDNFVTMYIAKVAFDAIPEFVRVGMTANEKFDVTTKNDVTLIPIEALKSTENSLFVYVPSSHTDEPDKRNVRTGISDGQKVEILEGLKPGDAVLIPKQSASQQATKSGAFGGLGAPF